MSIPESTTERGKCVVCGRAVTKRPDRNKTCSPECKAELCRRINSDTEWPSCRVHYGECRWCGRVVANERLARARFCSASHHTAHANWTRNGPSFEPTRVRLCRTCGGVFTVSQHGRRLYCSDICRKIASVPGFKGPTTQSCRYCGGEFWSDAMGPRWYCCREHRKRDERRRHKRLMRTDAEYAAKYRHAKHVCRMRERNTPGSHTAQEWRDRVAEYGGKCAHCRKRKATTKDHVIPRSRGGTDDITNILPSCRKCNCEMKRDLMPNEEWFADRAGQLALVIW